MEFIEYNDHGFPKNLGGVENPKVESTSFLKKILLGGGAVALLSVVLGGYLVDRQIKHRRDSLKKVLVVDANTSFANQSYRESVLDILTGGWDLPATVLIPTGNAMTARARIWEDQEALHTEIRGREQDASYRSLSVFKTSDHEPIMGESILTYKRSPDSPTELRYKKSMASSLVELDATLSDEKWSVYRIVVSCKIGNARLMTPIYPSNADNPNALELSLEEASKIITGSPLAALLPKEASGPNGTPFMVSIPDSFTKTLGFKIDEFIKTRVLFHNGLDGKTLAKPEKNK